MVRKKSVQCFCSQAARVKVVGKPSGRGGFFLAFPLCPPSPTRSELQHLARFSPHHPIFCPEHTLTQAPTLEHQEKTLFAAFFIC